jgi:Rieske Fe-S protein
MEQIFMMHRRNFLKVIGGSAALVAIDPSLITQTLFASDGSLYKTYEKVMLVDDLGKPILASSLKKETNYIFKYPYKGTPVLLVDLGLPTNQNVKLKAEDGSEYVFKGGAGKNRSIVAVSAICQHQLTHPRKSESFFNYIPRHKMTAAYKHGGVFVCSSHLSVYDPKNGSVNVAGPAAQGLANIVLDIDEKDQIWAVGVLGKDKFHDFFKNFKPEFKSMYGNWRKAKKIVKINTPTELLSEYTKDIIIY